MAALKPNFLIRNIYKDSQITLQLCIPPPETISLGARYTVNYNPILYLMTTNNPPGETTEQWKSRRYPIKPSNLYNTVAFFETVLGWFHDPEISDLYLETENGIVFNTKYDNLGVLTKKNYFDDCQMKAVPALIEIAQGKYTEGIYLFINRKSNMITVSKESLEAILHALVGFDFTSDTILTLELLKHTINCGTFVSESEYKQRRENNGFTMK